MEHARGVPASIMKGENVIVWMLLAYVAIQSKPIDNYRLFKVYAVDLPLWQINRYFFIILTINGQQNSD